MADFAVIASDCNEIDIRKNFLEEEQTFLVASSDICKGKGFQEIFNEYAFISYDDNCSFSNIIDQFFKKSGLQTISTIMVGGSDEMIKRVVLNRTGYAILGENVIKNEIKDGSITILQQVSEPIVTSAINLKVRSEEPNIQTFHEFIQNAWPVSCNHASSHDSRSLLGI